MGICECNAKLLGLTRIMEAGTIRTIAKNCRLPFETQYLLIWGNDEYMRSMLSTMTAYFCILKKRIQYVTESASNICLAPKAGIEKVIMISITY